MLASHVVQNRTAPVRHTIIFLAKKEGFCGPLIPLSFGAYMSIQLLIGQCYVLGVVQSLSRNSVLV